MVRSSGRDIPYSSLCYSLESNVLIPVGLFLSRGKGLIFFLNQADKQWLTLSFSTSLCPFSIVILLHSMNCYIFACASPVSNSHTNYKGMKEIDYFSFLTIIFQKSQLFLLLRHTLASVYFTEYHLYTSKDKNVPFVAKKWPCIALKLLREFGDTGD